MAKHDHSDSVDVLVEVARALNPVFGFVYAKGKVDTVVIDGVETKVVDVHLTFLPEQIATAKAKRDKKD